MKAKPLLVFFSPKFKDHDTGSHPENGKRMDAIAQRLRQDFAEGELEWREPRLAETEELKLVHTDAHIQHIQSIAAKGGGMADPDTIVSPASYETGRLSAGAGLSAIDAVCSLKSGCAFVASRPPGHHASANRAMGFCLFNNIAIAARYAQQKHGIRKALILDWDVHHGNGTQNTFYEDDEVYYLSTHQHPLYPGTGMTGERGKGKGEGYTRNLPFPPLTEPKRIVEAVSKALEEIAAAFQPGIVLISAGFDGHKDDPLGNWLLQEEHFTALTEIALQFAERCKAQFVVSFLEGGYNLTALAASASAHCRAMVGKEATQKSD
ncbi:MAG: histone deacetylase [Candidatus Omnitrophota bacterium]